MLLAPRIDSNLRLVSFFLAWLVGYKIVLVAAVGKQAGSGQSPLTVTSDCPILLVIVGLVFWMLSSLI